MQELEDEGGQEMLLDDMLRDLQLDELLERLLSCLCAMLSENAVSCLECVGCRRPMGTLLLWQLRPSSSPIRIKMWRRRPQSNASPRLRSLLRMKTSKQLSRIWDPVQCSDFKCTCFMHVKVNSFSCRGPVSADHEAGRSEIMGFGH